MNIEKLTELAQNVSIIFDGKLNSETVIIVANKWIQFKYFDSFLCFLSLVGIFGIISYTIIKGIKICHEN